MSKTPFGPEAAIEKSKLGILFPVSVSKSQSEKGSSALPSEEDQLLDYLPGYPQISLDQAHVHRFLVGELSTPVLDELQSILWLFSVKSGGNIDPLHRQRIKGRQIVPTEEAKLHLVWMNDKIYVKTMPICLLNHQVWEAFLQPEEQNEIAIIPQTGFDSRIALGFLRSYAFLIRSPLDLSIAKETHLIPEGLQVDWIQWAKFIEPFHLLDDTQVAKRYEFGQIRLNRLNWAVSLLRPISARGWYYQRQHWSISKLLKGSFSILLFAFASLSLVLSSMQVMSSISIDELSLSGIGGEDSKNLNRAFWIFSLITVIGSGLTWAVLILVPVAMFLDQIIWAIRNKGDPPQSSRIREPYHVYRR